MSSVIKPNVDELQKDVINLLQHTSKLMERAGKTLSNASSHNQYVESKRLFEKSGML
ncbi:hypothetical protein [Nostoc favosum]|uniref:Uncharacterized protein n=1 Tax=Nostoc favosum CHAB5714 TaxID=2780399 RepID=A0ABS8IA62_9NOSO|nr:hypothetical protein [Nostoc favosum]MCC5600921.1 hypothetical protein [Nostoc favosum CHAB5714]